MSVLRRAAPPPQLLADVELARSLAAGRLSRRRRATRRHRSDFYREMWTRAAASLGAPARPAGDGALEIDLGSTRVRVQNNHCSIDGARVLGLAGDKAQVYALLARAGLPVPAHAVFALAAPAPARRFLLAAPAECVVKPARDTSAGRGVTTGLRDPRDLMRASALAASQGARADRGVRSGGPLRRMALMHRALGEVPLLIEHQVPGENYRLLYLDGAFIDAVRRGSPTLVADGRAKVGAQLERLNAERLRAGGHHAQWLVSRDLDLERTLAAQGLSLASIPAAGTRVKLKTVVNENAPENNHPARAELCEAIVAQGARAAEVVGARLAGVDLITPDPRVPLEEAGGRILEVNTTPGLAIHYHGHEGAVDPAMLLLRRLSGADAPRAVR